MRNFLLLLTSIMLGFLSINAQQSQEEITEEMSKKAANPLADIMSFPFQNNLNMNYGEFNRNVDVLNIQPVIPFELKNGNIMTRTIIPFVSIPDFSNEDGGYSSGLADIVLTGFYVPKSKITWGLGPVLEIPTGGSKRGSEKWSAGPSFVILVQPKDWTFGALINNTWSFAGNSDRADVNHMLFNAFIVKQLGEGWFVSSAPNITADWNATSGNKWIVPLGGGGGKLVMLGGKLPLNLQTQLYYNVVRTDFGQEWQWRVQAQIFLPKSIFKKKEK